MSAFGDSGLSKSNVITSLSMICDTDSVLAKDTPLNGANYQGFGRDSGSEILPFPVYNVRFIMGCQQARKKGLAVSAIR